MIRKDALGKYLLYAIGEILIVTLGIFIAIQLDNWNDDEQTEATIETIFEEIQANLENSNNRLEQIIEWYAERDSLINLVKTGALTYEDYQNNDDLLTLINFYASATLDKSGYLKLQDYLGVTDPKYDTIILKLNILYDQLLPINERYELVMEAFNHRMHERWAQKYSWFSEPRDVVHKEERIQHFLTSPEYQNDVRLFSMYSRDNYAATLRGIDNISDSIMEDFEVLNAQESPKHLLIDFLGF